MLVFCILGGSAKKVPEHFSAQDELVEILNDFKNNVFSIAEIEMLVQNWQKRNDVQQSFKDKQVMTQECEQSVVFQDPCQVPTLSHLYMMPLYNGGLTFPKIQQNNVEQYTVSCQN